MTWGLITLNQRLVYGDATEQPGGGRLACASASTPSSPPRPPESRPRVTSPWDQPQIAGSASSPGSPCSCTPPGVTAGRASRCPGVAVQLTHPGAHRGTPRPTQQQPPPAAWLRVPGAARSGGQAPGAAGEQGHRPRRCGRGNPRQARAARLSGLPEDWQGLDPKIALAAAAGTDKDAFITKPCDVLWLAVTWDGGEGFQSPGKMEGGSGPIPSLPQPQKARVTLTSCYGILLRDPRCVPKCLA